MIDVKRLTKSQRMAFEVMNHFKCDGIRCEDCPLYSDEHGCGSQRAGNIIHQYEKETKQ